MLSKSVKISVLSLFAVAFAAEAFAQATINSMDYHSDNNILTNGWTWAMPASTLSA